LVLGDPTSFPGDGFVGQVNEDFPGLRVVGGMSSGGDPGDGMLVLGTEMLPGGAVGVLLQGGPPVRTVVSQGCRPIGEHMIVTKARDNLILEMGGKPALLRLQELWQTLSA